MQGAGDQDTGSPGQTEPFQELSGLEELCEKRKAKILRNICTDREKEQAVQSCRLSLEEKRKRLEKLEKEEVKEEQLNRKKEQLTEIMGALQRNQKELDEEQKKLQGFLEEAAGQKADYDKNKESLEKLDTEIEARQGLDVELEKARNEERRLEQKKKEDDRIRGSWKRSGQNIKRARNAAIEAAGNIWQRSGYSENAQAGILAKDLEEGMPCPVCGAIHHPKKAELLSDVPTQEELDRIKEQIDQAEGREKQNDQQDPKSGRNSWRIWMWKFCGEKPEKKPAAFWHSWKGERSWNRKERSAKSAWRLPTGSSESWRGQPGSPEPRSGHPARLWRRF
mgnify:CR=1 FL=1